MTEPYERRGIAGKAAYILTIALAAAPAACGGPHFVPDPEFGIELRWPNGENDFDAAQAMATARCPAYERPAELAMIARDRDETLARFFCR